MRELTLLLAVSLLMGPSNEASFTGAVHSRITNSSAGVGSMAIRSEVGFSIRLAVS